ncbi:MAG: hypothetical protein JSR54_07435 [Proteobacteria bacterium]|nr:hypothetical protein [Pseudomonadota bacterium]
MDRNHARVEGRLHCTTSAVGAAAYLAAVPWLKVVRIHRGNALRTAGDGAFATSALLTSRAQGWAMAVVAAELMTR